MTILKKVDVRAPLKILARCNTICLKQPTTTMCKATWKSDHKKEAESHDDYIDKRDLCYDDKFAIDWMKSGHYKFEPPLPLALEDKAKEHMFTGISFKGILVPLASSDHNARGHWKIKNNHCDRCATAYNPEKSTRRPDRGRYACRVAESACRAVVRHDFGQ